MCKRKKELIMKSKAKEFLLNKKLDDLVLNKFGKQPYTVSDALIEFSNRRRLYCYFRNLRHRLSRPR